MKFGEMQHRTRTLQHTTAHSKKSFSYFKKKKLILRIFFLKIRNIFLGEFPETAKSHLKSFSTHTFFLVLRKFEKKVRKSSIHLLDNKKNYILFYR
jgi:hypothetical protein